MQQEQDTCRICSGPGEPDQPLFHPCKCSGTIRYIHQDCLKTWLDHSKKSTCDVCKHPYAFTKVYAPDMPDRVPVTIIARKFAEQVTTVILFMLRAMLVAFVWLILLPYGTVLTWRLYFRTGSIIAWWISLHPQPAFTPAYSILNGTRHTASNDSLPLNGHTPPQHPQLSDVILQNYLRNLSADIFTGQIIASLIVLTFLAVFLLREWIQQNARPGVFDDAPAPQAHALVDHQPQAEPEPENVDLGHEVEEAIDGDDNAQWAPGALDAAVPAPPLMQRPVPDVPEDVRPAGPSSSSSSSSDTEEPPPSLPALPPRGFDIPGQRMHRGRAAQKRHVMEYEEDDIEINTRSRRFKREDAGPSRWRSKTSKRSSSRGSSMSALYALEGRPKSGNSDSSSVKQEYAGRSSSAYETVGFKARQKRKAEDSDTEMTSRHSSTSPERRSPPTPNSDFEFTFKAPRLPSDGASTFPAIPSLPRKGDFKFKPRMRSSSQPGDAYPSSTEHSTRSTRSSSPEPFSFGLDGDMPSTSRGTASRSVFELPPLDETNGGALADLPFPLTPRTSVPPPQPAPSPDLQLNTDDVTPPHSDSFSNSLHQPPASSSTHHGAVAARRPTLPTSTLPSTEHINAEAGSSTLKAASTTPFPSPHLAIYRPPEELEVEDAGYFGSVGQTRPQEDGTREEEEEEDEEEDTRFAYYFREPEQEDAKEVPVPLLPDTEDEEDGDGDEDEHDVVEPRNGGAAQPIGDIPAAARDAAGPDIDPDIADDERDQNLEEDLDGAMEAVGLRGPVFTIFQNAALMLFILNVSIGGGVWIPFTLGKTIALLTLEPRRALQIIHLPIRAVRLVTDPSVDGLIFCLRLIGDYFVAWSKTICMRTLHVVGILLGKGIQERIWTLFSRINVNPVISLFTFSGDDSVSASVGEATARMGVDLLSYVPIMRRDFIPSLVLPIAETPAFRATEEGFAVIGRKARIASAAALREWINLAEGDGTLERLWSILLGYAFAAFLAALYLNTITVGNVKSAGRAVRNAVRQQMIVLKVALFIVVELVMFPFGCGVMLDASTLALFPEASVESRVSFFLYAPITAVFYHWLIGTMFMYQFAILLATCRDILRPGCMWFIKDPQDPTFHPIRDILDRPTLAQLRKLCMSAVMYAVVISLGVGSIVWGLTLAAPMFLPLRWKMREPMSEIPIDLLFVHLILPPTLHYFRPKKSVRRLMTAWWRWTARQLRLTSFMFGGRHSSEEFKSVHWSWPSLWSEQGGQQMFVMGERDGGFRRCPAGDNIAFLRDKSALVEVDETGAPIDAIGRDIILAQNAEARRAGRNFLEDYTVVYVPPNFRRRILLFILLFWVCGSIAMVSAIAVPVLTGRAIFGFFSPRELHDGYAFVVGFYILWWAWIAGSLIVRVRVRRQRHVGSKRIRAAWLLFILKRLSVYASKVVWLTFWLGIVLPTLVSIVTDLYLILPVRFFLNPEFTPTIHIVESWATGLIISKIIIRTQRNRRGIGHGGALETLQRNGWRRPDPWSATRDFIIPIGTGLVGMILLPPLLVYGCSRITTMPWKLEHAFRFVYPSIFVVVAVCQFALGLVGVFTKWTQSIRDKEFLVELRLRNLDHLRKTEKATRTDRGSGDAMTVDEG